MSSDINPFEPWRPHGQQPEEPTWYREHPPRSEPVKEDLPPGDPYEEERGRSARGKFATAFTAFVLVGALAVWIHQGWPSVWRVLAVVGCAWLGVVLSLVVLWWLRWPVRLGVLLVGLGGAAACWFFVPTTGGLSLFDGQRRLEEV